MTVELVRDLGKCPGVSESAVARTVLPSRQCDEIWSFVYAKRANVTAETAETAEIAEKHVDGAGASNYATLTKLY